MVNGFTIFNHSLHQIYGGVIWHIVDGRIFQEDNIRLFAFFNTANLIGSVNCGSSVNGECGDNLFDGHIHIDTSKGYEKRNIVGEAASRIQIRGNGDCAAAVDHLSGRRIFFLQAECRGRKKGADDT